MKYRCITKVQNLEFSSYFNPLGDGHLLLQFNIDQTKPN